MWPGRPLWTGVLRAMGWMLRDVPPPSPGSVVIFHPHRSNRDVPLGLLARADVVEQLRGRFAASESFHVPTAPEGRRRRSDPATDTLAAANRQQAVRVTAGVTAEDFRARHKAYQRERAVVAFFGHAPLILLYVLTHGSWLKTQMPQSKELAVLYLVILPIAWFALLMLLHRWLGPLRHRLRCSQCSHALVAREFERTIERGACPQCGATTFEPGTVSA
jgi:hypothetical protein